MPEEKQRSLKKMKRPLHRIYSQRESFRFVRLSDSSGPPPKLQESLS